MNSCGIFLALMSPMSAPEWDLRVTEIFVCDREGKKKEYALGEGPVYLCVKVGAEGSGDATYELDVELAGRTHRFTDRRPQKSVESYVLQLGLAAHATMPFHAEVDPDAKLDKRRANNTAQGVLNPVCPAGVEWYAPRRYRVHQKWQGQFEPAPPERLVVASPIITTMGYQTVESWVKDPASEAFYALPDRAPTLALRLANPIQQPVTLEQIAVVQVQNFRVNPSALSGSWVAYDALPFDVRPWLASPKNSPEDRSALEALFIKRFPGDVRTTSTPVEAAARAFMATVEALEYQPEGHARVAESLRDGVALCEGYAEVYAGLVRKLGMPARVVNGWVAAEGEGPKAPLDAHSWVEVWFPKVGWVPQDPTFADTEAERANVPCFFYVLPHLNRRIAVSYNVPFKIEEGVEAFGMVGPSHWFSYKAEPPKLKVDRTFTIEPLGDR